MRAEDSGILPGSAHLRARGMVREKGIRGKENEPEEIRAKARGKADRAKGLLHAEEEEALLVWCDAVEILMGCRPVRRPRLCLAPGAAGVFVLCLILGFSVVSGRLAGWPGSLFGRLRG